MAIGIRERQRAKKASTIVCNAMMYVFNRDITRQYDNRVEHFNALPRETQRAYQILADQYRELCRIAGGYSR